jgi:hypothetical protein
MRMGGRYPQFSQTAGSILEAAPGVEPGDKRFAILCLTAWLCRHVERLGYLNIRSGIMEDKTV